MGTIRNEMTIVHHWKKDELEKVRDDAIKFFNEVASEYYDTYTNISDLMISPIMESYINQEYTFIINGECSKIGWKTSERFHEARM